MKIQVFVLSANVPDEEVPAIPDVFATLAEAEAKAMELMRQEWDSVEPTDDDDENIPFPEGLSWEEVQEQLVEATVDNEELWGRYEITGHSIEIDVSAAG